jgi:hypothetical protein
VTRRRKIPTAFAWASGGVFLAVQKITQEFAESLSIGEIVKRSFRVENSEAFAVGRAVEHAGIRFVFENLRACRREGRFLIS